MLLIQPTKLHAVCKREAVDVNTTTLKQIGPLPGHVAVT